MPVSTALPRLPRLPEPTLADKALTREVTQAVWPWARTRRWTPGNPPEESVRGKELWILDKEPFVAVLVVKAGKGGPRLQIPLAASGDTPVIGRTTALNLRDGTVEPSFWEAWVRLAAQGEARAQLLEAAHRVHPLGVEQSNTSVLLEGGPQPYIAKVFRVLHPGAHPEVEVPAALTKAGWKGVPQIVAYWDLPSSGEGPAECSAVVSELVPEAQDGFQLLKMMAASDSPADRDARRLGQLTAQMHRLLAESFGVGEPLSGKRLAGRVGKSLSALAKENVAGLDGKLVERLGRLVKGMRATDSSIPTSRIHGDLHLGQTLRGANGDWFIIDFEGEPLKDISERSELDNPLRDVAGMLRSLDYAAQGAPNPQARDAWRRAAQEAFLDGYSSENPLSKEELRLLDLLQLEKALYEVDYERRFRPTYLPVPLGALEELSQPPLK